MGNIQKTVKDGVRTTKGLIPYLTHSSGKFQMPVKVKRAPNSINGHPRPPVLTQGFLVFALPCGVDYVSGYTLDDVCLIR
jgi:hypothetical protein